MSKPTVKKGSTQRIKALERVEKKISDWRAGRIDDLTACIEIEILLGPVPEILDMFERKPKV